jgi:glucose-6-phosphate isomerase
LAETSIDPREFAERLRRKDPSLWSADPAVQARVKERLGWVTVHRSIQATLREVLDLAGWVRELDFSRSVLLGMGGSSLAPQVLQQVLGTAAGFPDLLVLDTTDPTAIAQAENQLEIETTLFIVSSKSGTTIETSSLQRYFAERMRDATGDTPSLDNFIAITDPGTPLHHQAVEEAYHKVFLNPPDIGGRYSALSFFGLVPAAVSGADVQRLLQGADTVDWEDAVALGVHLGDLALQGRDKVTFIADGGLTSFGTWAEQLLAESTGKRGKGLIPVQGEPTGPAESYGDDRVFVAIASAGDVAVARRADALERAGHPVVRVLIEDPHEIAREFIRWEAATAAAGAVLGINPFDEPNVQESKDNTREVIQEYVRAGRMPDGRAQKTEDCLALHVNELPAGDQRTVGGVVAEHFARFKPPHFAAIMAYIAPTEEHDRLLAQLQEAVRNATRMATTVGYGPRFLHSTGQLHKGGPPAGVFLQITTDDATDEDIPGESALTFGTLKQAQALGDLRALESRGLPVIRVHLQSEGDGALRRLVESVGARLLPLSAVRGE